MSVVESLSSGMGWGGGGNNYIYFNVFIYFCLLHNICVAFYVHLFYRSLQNDVTINFWFLLLVIECFFSHCMWSFCV